MYDHPVYHMLLGPNEAEAAGPSDVGTVKRAAMQCGVDALDGKVEAAIGPDSAPAATANSKSRNDSKGKVRKGLGNSKLAASAEHCEKAQQPADQWQPQASCLGVEVEEI